MSTLRSGILTAVGMLAIGCGPSGTIHPVSADEALAAGSPLGASYILVPAPSNDDGLLGRILIKPPTNGQSLDEVSRPNECADKLTPKRQSPMASTFEDTKELAAGARARAALGPFGFEGDAQTASLFYYKVEVAQQLTMRDTTEYVACCRSKGTCGYGFISTLIYGDGLYATATESHADGGVSIPLAGGAGGFIKAKVLHKRSVHGYVAALITLSDSQTASSIGVLGDATAVGVALSEQNLPDQVKKRYEARKIIVAECVAPTQMTTDGLCRTDVSRERTQPTESAYVFQDQNGEMTENAFVRRYHELTGGNELNQANFHRNLGDLLAACLWCSLG